MPAAAIFFFAPAAFLAWSVGPEVPTLGGALIGAVLFVMLVRRMEPTGQEARRPSAISLFRAGLPYVAVLLLILATRLVPALAEFLRNVTIEWIFAGDFTGSVAPLYHPGTILMVARMIDTLALTAERMLGSYWPIAVPIVGALGSFVTGSATTSNILFADFQVAAAGASGLTALLGLAGQGFGSAIGNIIAPHNIVAGAATVGLVGREGDVLKRTLPICLAYGLAGGMILFLIAGS